MSAKQKQNGVSGQISWKLMCGVKGTLHAVLNAPALSEAGPRWGGVWGWGVGGGGKCPPNRNMAYWCKGDRLHATLNAPALSEAGPRWGDVYVCACGRVCVWGGGGGEGGGAEGKCPPNRNMAYWCQGDRHCMVL